MTLATALLLFSLSALAEYRPGPHRPHPGPRYPAPQRPYPIPRRPMPIPRPMPRPVPAPYCQVLMIDNWHAVYRTYRGQCNVVMNQCLYDLRFNRPGLRCVQERGYW